MPEVINEEGLSELAVSDEDMSIGEFSFEEFCDAFGDGLFDEDTYNEAIAKIKDLGIKSAYEYRETENPGSTDHLIYDPIAKEYIQGNQFPAGVVDMTDAFAEQLAKQGSNKDPEDLSVEEAYDLLAEMMSGEDNGEPDAETESLFKDLFSDDFFSGY